jgi:hypothetical protein
VSVIDDEDRIWKARCAEAPDGWPFDADRGDPLTAMRIAVTSSHPMWAYLVAFDQQSEARPTDHESALLASYLDEYKSYWYNDSYRLRMEARPLDVDGGANGVIFHKWAADDWGLPASLVRARSPVLRRPAGAAGPVLGRDPGAAVAARTDGPDQRLDGRAVAALGGVEGRPSRGVRGGVG